MTKRPNAQERELLRLLRDPRGERGELSPERARELGRRLRREPELAARFEALKTAWEGLEAPPAVPPPGFTARVMARVREQRVREQRVRAARPGSLATAPAGVRWAAALALVVGLAAGPLLVRQLPSAEPASTATAPTATASTAPQTALAEEADWLAAETSLAESYLSALEGGGKTDDGDADDGDADDGDADDGTRP